jgi:hypothetical protein
MAIDNRRRTFAFAQAVTLTAVLIACAHATAQSAGGLPAFDFRQPGAVAEWGEQHDIKRIEATEQGMAIHIDGPDPYLSGPARDYPPGVPLFLKVRLKPPVGGALQVFFFGPGQISSEENSVRVPVRRGGWQTVSLALPPLGRGFRLRLDPPGSRGVCLIESIRSEPRLEVAAPAWPRPSVPETDDRALVIESGRLVLRQQQDMLGGFTLQVDGQLVATGHNRPLVGYIDPASKNKGQPPAVRWLDVAANAQTTANLDPSKKALTVEARFRDLAGAGWRLRQTFRPGAPGSIAVSAECSADAPREVVFLPLLLVLPGHGSFGALKGQGLFAGVEYLENEPSSSTADLNEPAALRRVPDSAKITFPLLAVQANGRYIGLIWDPTPDLAALFDSPDRLFGTEGHVCGLVAPGANGENRTSGALCPREPLALAAGQPIRASALLIGGRGESVVPAVQQYVSLRGLPPRPPTPDLEGYVHLAAAGWLDSPIRSGGRFRHALVGSFPAHSAADAAWMISWLAGLTRDEALRARLRSTADEAAASVQRPDLLVNAAIGHNRYPVAPLVLAAGLAGDGVSSASHSLLTGSLDQARAMSRALPRQFEPDGSIRFRAPAGGTDYGRTHFCDEASGLTAGPVFHLLESAAFAGDRAMVEEGLRLLRMMQRRFDQGVPRGAQTWEIPLHTPDILASAYLVKAFTLGYELTADAALLDAARYWAWTGVPFVYLVDPTSVSGSGVVGPFATTPVLGATNWTEPNWIGLPVQWCGLVYAQGLFELARYDPSGPWRSLAEGITASGIAQTYPLNHPHRGLLPDSFELSTQTRRAPDINPATLQPLALRLLAGDRTVPYEFHALRQSGLWIHAPGSVEAINDEPGACRLTLKPWSQRASFLVIHMANPGIRPRKVLVDKLPVDLDSQREFLQDRGTLILLLPNDKPTAIEIRK